MCSTSLTRNGRPRLTNSVTTASACRTPTSSMRPPAPPSRTRASWIRSTRGSPSCLLSYFTSTKRAPRGALFFFRPTVFLVAYNLGVVEPLAPSSARKTIEVSRVPDLIPHHHLLLSLPPPGLFALRPASTLAEHGRWRSY